MSRRKRKIFEDYTVEDMIEKCQRKREIESCEECCHYPNCSFHGYDNKSEELTRHEEALALAIIQAQVMEYEEMYKIGAKNGCKKVLLFLRSEMMSLMCLYKFSSDFIINNLNARLEKEYGPFEDIYNAKIKDCEKHIAYIDEKLIPYQEEYRRQHRLTKKQQELLSTTDGMKKLPKDILNKRLKLLSKLKLTEKEKKITRPLYIERAYWEKKIVE